MTYTIEHQYDEILPGAWPGLEIHVVYYCESEIEIDEDGEHDPRLISISAFINTALKYTKYNVPFPRESDGQAAREFLAKLRESARQALWANALEMAKQSQEFDGDPIAINEIANRWMRTGSTKLAAPLPLEKPFVI